MSERPEPDDFVGIVGGLTNYIQNQRVAAYNEAVDMMLGSVRAWMRERDIQPDADDLPELLDQIESALRPTNPALAKISR